MKRTPLTEQVEAVSRLEDELAAARKKAAESIRSVRIECGLTLREIGPLVHRAPSALSYFERGESWETSTARLIARVLVEKCAERVA